MTIRSWVAPSNDNEFKELLREHSAKRLEELTTRINLDDTTPQFQKDIWHWANRGDHVETMVVRLTPRQKEIMESMCSGKHDGSNKSIARELKISASTVKCHFALICAKFNLCSRAQATAWYLRSTGQVKEHVIPIAQHPSQGNPISIYRRRK